MNAPIATASLESPLGPIILRVTSDALHSVRIGGTAPPQSAPHPLLDEALCQFSAWFAGRLQIFDLPLLPCETEEGAAMRAAMAAIPYGETRTYGDLARATGSSARAMGQACRTNAYPLLIPCHRVVSADGSAYYSAGDGARTKGWLIDFEAQNLPPNQRTRLL